MLKELWIFALLVLVRWQMGTLYPILTSNLLEWIFTAIVLLCGICYGLNKYFKKYPVRVLQPINTENNTLRSFFMHVYSNMDALAGYFLPLLLVFLVRSFVFDTNYVVSGSMKPTLQIGDIALVKKYRYGVRLPLTKTLLMSVSLPRRGDIITFRLPQDHSKIFIKRMIGLPGDHIQYKQKRLTINGESISQRLLNLTQDEDYGSHRAVLQSEETLQAQKYSVYTLLDEPFEPLNTHTKEVSLQVPEGHYFVIGDNRDNSLDSRYWGFLPKNCLVGQADRIIFSSDSKASWRDPLSWVRWKRIGKTL